MDGSNQGYFQDPFGYPPLNTPIYQGPNEPPVQGFSPQGFVNDLFYYPPLTTPTEIEQIPSIQPVQGYLQDHFNYPPLSTPTETDQTPNRPQIHGPSTPPRVQTSGQKRECFVCHGKYMQAINLGDGRYLCPDCFSLSVIETNQLTPIINQVHSFFQDHLGLPVKKDIPIFLINKNQMAKHARPTAQGVTKPYHKATIEIVKTCVRRGADMEVVTEKKEVKRDKLVILLLFGYPKPILGATLAHEMGHALIWRLDLTCNLKRKVEEGICEAIAYKWLKYTINNHDPSYTQREAEIAERLRRQEMSKIKREGTVEFREAHKAIKKNGLKQTLSHFPREWEDGFCFWCC